MERRAGCVFPVTVRMKRSFPLAYKILLAFIAVLLPIIIVFFLSLNSTRKHVEELILDDLRSISEARAGELFLFFEIMRNRVIDFASDGVIRDEFEKAVRAGVSESRPLSEYIVANKFPLEKSFFRISVINTSGVTIASTNSGAIGNVQSEEEFFLNGIEGITISMREKGLRGVPELAVATPVHSRSDGKLLGVIVGFVTLEKLEAVFMGTPELAEEDIKWSALSSYKSLDIYLVNRDRLMLTKSPLAQLPPLKQKVATAPVEACFEKGQDYSGYYTDYRGVDVAGSSICMLPYRWVFVAEVDTKEALHPVREIRLYGLVTMIVAIALISALVAFFYRVAVKQLRRLAASSREMAAGNYDITLPVESEDEIGVLTDSFNNMARQVKERNQALRESEARFRAIMDNTINVVYLKSPDGRYIFINRIYEALFHVSNEGVRGKTDHDLFPREVADVFRENDQKALESPAPLEFEETVPFDGRRIYLSVKFRLLDESGKPYALAGISTDITELKRSQEALRRSEASLANAQRIAGLGSWEYDLTAMKGSWSEETYSLFGIRKEEWTNGYDDFMRVLHPDYKDMVLRTIETSCSTGRAYSMDYKIIRPDGTQRFMHEEGEVVCVDEIPVKLSGTVQDITGRVAAEAALRRSEASLANAQRIAHIGNWDWDIVTNELIWSDEIYRIFGVAPKEFGATYDAFLGYVHPDDREFVMSSVSKALSDRMPYSIDHRVVLGDGAERIVHEQGEVTFDESGKAVKMSGTVQDITERKRAEEEVRKLNIELEKRVADRTRELQEAYQELEAFSYSVAHDLRAPLRIIDGFTRILLKEYQEKFDDTGRDYMARVSGASQRMGQLIDALLKLAHVMRTGITREEVDLSAFSENVAEELRKAEPGRRAVFSIAGGMAAKGDPSLLRLVLENLIGNAWKFTSKKEEASIEVGVEQAEDGGAVYFVRDNGAGFDMKYADRLFNPFQRLHAEMEFPGTGIGLSTVQRIIQRHGGRIWAIGQKDRGATFYFTLQ
jgi:PAS domain S-box-containing protein